MESILIAARPWIALGALYALALAAVVAVSIGPIVRTYRRARPLSRAVFFVGVAGIALYAGSKGGHISYPFTDPETHYLTDAGSWVSNNTVHVAFTRSILVPASASFFVDYYDGNLTNAADIATNATTAFSATFAARPVPFDLAFANATNYNWLVYTDWTPPPVVHTNGVAFVAWTLGSTTNNLATTRTGIYTNAVKIAPHIPQIQIQLTTTNEDNDE